MSEINLKVGAKIRIGEKCSERTGLTQGEVLELVEGYFDYWNGLYDTTVTAPAIYNDEEKDFDSIYHLFGNDLEDFLDSEITDQQTQSDEES